MKSPENDKRVRQSQRLRLHVKEIKMNRLVYFWVQKLSYCTIILSSVIGSNSTSKFCKPIILSGVKNDDLMGTLLDP